MRRARAGSRSANDTTSNLVPTDNRHDHSARVSGADEAGHSGRHSVAAEDAAN